MITICNSPNPNKKNSSFNVYGGLISQCRFTYATRRPGARCFWVKGWRPASCGLAFPPKVIESALLACCFDTPIVVMFRFFVGKAWHFEMLYIFGGVFSLDIDIWCFFRFNLAYVQAPRVDLFTLESLQTTLDLDVDSVTAFLGNFGLRLCAYKICLIIDKYIYRHTFCTPDHLL